MKISTLILTQLANPTVDAKRPDSTDDIGFNLDRESSEIAQLEKYHQLGLKFFRLHKQDLRSSFVEKWGGVNGRFEKEVKKLTKTFKRCGSSNLDPYNHEDQVMHITSDQLKIPENHNDQDTNGDGVVDWKDAITTINQDVNGDGDIDWKDEFESTLKNSRKRRELSPRELIDGELEEDHHNPGQRILHVLRNMQRWAEAYLPECSNQNIIIERYDKFLSRFKTQLEKVPVFVEEFQHEERALKRLRATARETAHGAPCGYLYRDYGLHGSRMLIMNNRPITNLHNTDFGGDQLSSMQPLPGCYIRAFEHPNMEGYSSVCDDPNGCGVMNTWKNGPLENDEASSALCYCDADAPRHCGRIFQHSVNDDRRWTQGQAPIFDGAKLGLDHMMHKYVDNDELSSISVESGCSLEIWKDTNKSGSSFTCPSGTTCDYYDLGSVGNDETSTVTCNCVKEFDRIEYPNFRVPPMPNIDDISAADVEIGLVRAENSCNPALFPNGCPPVKHTLTSSKTETVTVSWSKVFTLGASYTTEASATLNVPGVGSLGGKSSYTFSASTSLGHTATDTYQKTLTSSVECIAMPMMIADCVYLAWKQPITTDYVIYWKDGSRTAGVFEGTGWVVTMHPTYTNM